MPQTNPPPQPEIDIKRIAEDKKYLQTKAYNLEHNELSSTPYKVYWEYINAKLFKEVAIPEQPNFISTSPSPDFFSIW